MFTSTGTGLPCRVAGLELVLLHRLHCLLIQAHAQMAHDLHPLRITLRVHNQRNDAHALVLRSTRFIGKFRIR